MTGVDVSGDQLRVARDRLDEGVELAHGDAAAVPFDDASFDVVVARFIHTDVDDFGAVVAEAARVLRPGGRFVHVGLHPCFDGHFAENRGDLLVIHPGYWERSWKHEGVGIDPGRIRSRVGVRDIPLSDFFNTVPQAGLTLERVEEPAFGDPPTLLGVSATKPG